MYLLTLENYLTKLRCRHVLQINCIFPCNITSALPASTKFRPQDTSINHLIDTSQSSTSVALNTSICPKFVQPLDFGSSYANYKVNKDKYKYNYRSNKTGVQKNKIRNRIQKNKERTERYRKYRACASTTVSMTFSRIL